MLRGLRELDVGGRDLVWGGEDAAPDQEGAGAFEGRVVALSHRPVGAVDTVRDRRVAPVGEELDGLNAELLLV